MSTRPTELAIVIPVFNEAENLPGLLTDWQPEFQSTGVPYKVIFIDDGSTDNSLQLLRNFAAADPTLEVLTQRNAGHGPAVLKGYRLSREASWVFQIDSDHPFETHTFRELWANRESFDLLLAERRVKNAAPGRQWISQVSTAMVRLLYGKRVNDVNTPYRLIRGSCLAAALTRMPASPFAPNVLLSAWFVWKKKRIFTTVAEPRKEGGRRGRMNRYFLVGALRSALQTFLFRLR